MTDLEKMLEQDNAELTKKMNAYKKMIGFILPRIEWEKLDLEQREVVREAGIRVVLRHYPCPQTGVKEQYCTCKLHAHGPDLIEWPVYRR